MSEFEKALENLARYLAMRDHSEQELRTKLERRYSPEVTEKTIAFAVERELLAAPEILAERATRDLNRRRKSHLYIQSLLKKRGLPATAVNTDEELEKIRRLLNSKFGSAQELAYEEKQKAHRFLKYRGFEDALIHKVLNEKLAE